MMEKSEELSGKRTDFEIGLECAFQLCSLMSCLLPESQFHHLKLEIMLPSRVGRSTHGGHFCKVYSTLAST